MGLLYQNPQPKPDYLDTLMYFKIIFVTIMFYPPRVISRGVSGRSGKFVVRDHFLFDADVEQHIVHRGNHGGRPTHVIFDLGRIIMF